MGRFSGTPCRMMTEAEEMLITLRKVDSEFTVFGSHQCIGFQDNVGLYVLSLMEG